MDRIPLRDTIMSPSQSPSRAISSDPCPGGLLEKLTIAHRSRGVCYGLVSVQCLSWEEILGGCHFSNYGLHAHEHLTSED